MSDTTIKVEWVMKERSQFYNEQHGVKRGVDQREN